MIHGIDTTLLVQVEVSGHPGHSAARSVLERLFRQGDTLALAPQVLAEFIHVVTDAKRFERPLPMSQARERAARWWSSSDVVPALPDERTALCFLGWLREHALGRKRLLDTLLAATYFTNEIRSVVTTNARDFQVFGCFEVVTPE